MGSAPDDREPVAFAILRKGYRLSILPACGSVGFGVSSDDDLSPQCYFPERFRFIAKELIPWWHITFGKSTGQGRGREPLTHKLNLPEINQ